MAAHRARSSALTFVAAGLAGYLAVATLPACAAGLAGDNPDLGDDASPALDGGVADAGRPAPGHDAGGSRPPPNDDAGVTSTPQDSGYPVDDADPGGGFDAGNPDPGGDANGGGGGGGGGDDSGDDSTGPINSVPDAGGGGGSSCTGAPQWSPDAVTYQVGQYVTYNGAVYVCITAHTSQSDWSPPATPALWSPTSCPD